MKISHLLSTIVKNSPPGKSPWIARYIGSFTKPKNDFPPYLTLTLTLLLIFGLLAWNAKKLFRSSPWLPWSLSQQLTSYYIVSEDIIYSSCWKECLPTGIVSGFDLEKVGIVSRYFISRQKTIYVSMEWNTVCMSSIMNTLYIMFS